jgi:uncharacterized membrane protein
MEPSATPAQERELDRVGAFSDGVFAIAITLLVLNIEVPDVAGSELGDALSDLSGDLVTYGIGFAVIGLFWYGHHVLFARIQRSSGRLVAVNLALLAFIALMPFTTAVLGRYDEPLAVAVYAVNVGIAMILDGLLEFVAVRQRLLPVPSRAAADALIGAAVQSLVFFLSIPIAYAISSSLAKWFWLLLIVAGRYERRRGRRDDNENDAKVAA